MNTATTRTDRTYTYRGGKRVELEKRPDQFVVRALPDELRDLGFPDPEKVSSASSRITARAPDLEPLMARARSVAPTHHAYYNADSGDEFLITDRIIVRFKQAPPREQVDAFAARYGLVLREAYSDRDFLFQLTDHTGMNPVKLVVQLTEQEPGVELADHDLNRRVHRRAVTLPTDPAYARQWHLHRRFQHADVDPRSSSRCEEGWQVLGHLGSPDVVIGVTDDGCKLDHPDFDAPGKFAGWGYFDGARLVRRTDVDADPARMYQSGSNHGTSCAGVIAAETDSVLSVGAAPGCRLYPIKWESDGPSLFISDGKLLTALAALADQVDVVSSSWGIVPRSEWVQAVLDRITTLARTGGRRGRGILFLWAAGNENCPIQHSGAVDVPYTDGWNDAGTSWVGVQSSRTFVNNLVGIPGVAHVAALASTAQRSHYSNHGTGVTVCAPSSNSHEYWRLTVRGLGITTATGGGLTERFGGTSSATPLVAGVAALVISANPNLTALEVLSILKQTASKDLDAQPYARTPAAPFDLTPTWDVSPIAPFDSGAFGNNGDPDGTWSAWFGHGKVDAQAAVAEAIRRRGATGTGQVRKTSTPGRNIPDNAPQGIRDTIQVTETGAVQAARVAVDVTHTWIGDLRVRLLAPDGTAVVLHDRAGSSADHIRRVYAAADVPGLGALAGRPITGDWALEVQDLAAADTGVLRSWTLELETTPVANRVEDVAAMRIPDNDPQGVTRTLNVTMAGTIDQVAVSVDVTHSWIGDLIVTLVPPQGAPVRLQDRAGRDADNIVRTWRSEDTPALAALRGRPAAGAWRLQVVDVAREDEGKLNRWALEIVARPAVTPAGPAAGPAVAAVGGGARRR